MDIQALSVPQRLAFLTDGSTVPITNLFDAWGDETDDLADAVSFVCGAGRMWFSDRLDQYQTVRVH
jgi:hypothetical protein